MGFPGGSESRVFLQWGRPEFNARSGRSPGEENGNPLQYSWLENPMDRGGTWRATVHRVLNSQTWLSGFTFTFTVYISTLLSIHLILSFTTVSTSLFSASASLFSSYWYWDNIFYCLIVWQFMIRHQCCQLCAIGCSNFFFFLDVRIFKNFFKYVWVSVLKMQLNCLKSIWYFWGL